MKHPGIADDALDELQRRAAQLARPPVASAPAADTLQVLEFALAGRHCLLEARWIREVRRLGKLMPVPLAPAPALGLVPLRGGLLPVFDLAAPLGLPSSPAAPAGLLVVLGRSAPLLGIAAGEVHGLRTLAARDAERRSQPLEHLRPELVRGVTADGHLFLDGERLLSSFAQPAPPARSLS